MTPSSLSPSAICVVFPSNIERMFETFHQSPNGDFKPTFYNPFEIKHRRRTSKDQFQVLESSFLENCKPNAMVRRSLAARLGMTPRAVQVWFQNRRAKVKNLPQYAAESVGYDRHELNQSTSPANTGADVSSNVSSMASPSDPVAASTAAVRGTTKKALGRRHSMPNMAAVPKITPAHFKQLHEAIFGANGMSPNTALNYQVPLKQPQQEAQSQPMPQGQYEGTPSGYPSYYQAPSQTQLLQQKRNSVCVPPYMYPMMPQGHAGMYEQQAGVAEQAHGTGNTDLDLFLQSIITPQSQASSAQQQAYLSHMIAQADPAQLANMSDSLASFLCGPGMNQAAAPTAAGHAQSNQQMEMSNDHYLLSKYMNMNDE